MGLWVAFRVIYREEYEALLRFVLLCFMRNKNCEGC